MRDQSHENKNGHTFVVESKFIGTRKAKRALLKLQVGSNKIRAAWHGEKK